MTKRRLPVLQNRAEPDEPPRPAWHWVLFGAAAVFASWLPLASLAEWVKSRVIGGIVGPASDPAATSRVLAGLGAWDRARLAFVVVGLPAGALFVGAVAGGYLVGRYGDGVRARHGAAAAAGAAAIAGLLATVATRDLRALVPVLLGALPLAAAGGALGAQRGLARRVPPGAGV